MKNKINRLSPLLLAFLVGVAWLVFVICMSPVEESIDDSLISYEILARKDHLVLFVNPFLSKLLGFFYNLMPTVNWLNISNYAGMAAAICSFAFVLLHRKRTLQNWTFLACLALMAWLGSAYCINYTRTAGLITLGGGILYWDTFFRKDGTSPQMGVGAIFLMLWGAALRIQSFLLVMPFFVLICVMSFFMNPEKLLLLKNWKKQWKKLLRYVVWILLPLILGLCLQMLGMFYLKNQPGWKEYLAFNDIRTLLLDYSISGWEDVAAGMEGTGFTESDFTLVREMIYEKPDTITKENMEKLASLVKVGTAKSWWTYVRQGNMLLWLAVGTFVVLALINLRANLCGLLLAAAMAKLFVSYFIYLNRIPTRVYDTILMGAMTFAVFFCSAQRESRESLPVIGGWVDSLRIGELQVGKYFLEGLSLFLMVLLAAEFAIVKDIKPTRPFRINHTAETSAIDTMLASDRTYILTHSFSSKAYGLWRQPAAMRDSEHIILLGGWNSKTPEALRIREEKGLEDPFWALLYNPDVYGRYSTDVQRYLAQASGMGITVSQVDNTGGLSTVQYSYPILPENPEQNTLGTEEPVRCAVQETVLRLEEDNKEALRVTVEGLGADRLTDYSDCRINFYNDEGWTLTCRLALREESLDAAVVNFSMEFWAEGEAPKGYLIGRNQQGEYVRICGLELYQA